MCMAVAHGFACLRKSTLQKDQRFIVVIAFRFLLAHGDKTLAQGSKSSSDRPTSLILRQDVQWIVYLDPIGRRKEITEEDQVGALRSDH